VKFKLDENLGTRAVNVFRSKDHDVQTVCDQRLAGATDDRLYAVCRDEHRCLVTLDLDFADVTRFPASVTGGIVVIRVPKNPSPALLEMLVQQFLDHLSQIAVEKNL
jgi:predicted nuclease of predicted toxin-antitoxin system